MPEETNQSQEPDVQVAEPVGEEAPQVAEPTEIEELGAEEKPQAEIKVEKPERVFSQAEVSKMESAKDKEIAQFRQQLAQQSMQAELYKMQQAEESAKAKDQKEVDEGLITTSEASQRERTRQQQQYQHQEMTKQTQALRQMAGQAEQYGRVLAAQDFGKEYELNSDQITELLNDKEIKSPGDMRAKAANLALEKMRGELKKSKEAPPKFDSGVTGSKGKTEPESAKGKIKAGWIEEATKKRK